MDNLRAPCSSQGTPWSDDSGAWLRAGERSQRLAIVVVTLVVCVLALAGCAGQQRAPVEAYAGLGPARATGQVGIGGYAAKTWRVVVVARSGGEAPVPVSGVELQMWDSSAMVLRAATTGPDGSAAFVCRCEPQFYLGGKRLESAAQPDDVLPNTFNVLAEVEP